MAERDVSDLMERFANWRCSILGSRSKRELKGEELTPNQLNSFSYRVLPPTDRDVWLTVVGADTRVTSKKVIEISRDQAAVMFGSSADLADSHRNHRVKEMYRQMSGWARNRSAENVLWIYCLVETIIDTIQHFMVRFMEPEDDGEFEHIRIAIDQSFVRRDEHVIFWREWLRTELMGRAHREATAVPDTWRLRGHPFLRKYEMHPGLLNFNELFVKHTGFFQSHTMSGLQISDICANICYRYHRGEEELTAYHNLRPRVVGRDGCALHLVHLNESSLHKDDPRKHVGVFDVEEWKRRADEFRRKRVNPDQGKS